MKPIKNIFSLIFILILFVVVGKAQVKFKLQLLNDEKTYQVSLVPEISYRPPLNLTSTAQVTIKVPTGAFDLANLKSLQSQVEWEANSIEEAPEESKDYDYISFGLVNNGTQFLRYEIGMEIPIFTFENGVSCAGEVALMDNATDPFMPPNSSRKNVGNQITIAGAKGDAYTGNAVKSTVLCGQLSTNVAEKVIENIQVEMFPNPAFNQLNLSINLDKTIGNSVLVVYDILGKPIYRQQVALQTGNNAIILSTHQLAKGHYLLELNGEEGVWYVGQFLKMEK